MSENLPEIIERQQIAPRRAFFNLEPKDQIQYATEIAGVLRDVIKQQKLYTSIQGRDYVRVEGWQTLGVFLGIIPKERSVTKQNDGSYEAFVDLIKFSDGTVVGGGSALCSVDEKRWGSADEYARRSMAITRATGKAFRSAFSWIITLAGYEPIPEEEIPKEEKPVVKRDLKSEIKIGAQTTEIYTGTTDQQKKVQEHCEREKIDSKHWADIDARLIGKPFTKIAVGKAIHEAVR